MISEKELLDMRKRLSAETIDDQEEFSMWLVVNGIELIDEVLSFRDNVEKAKRTIIRWSPRRLTAADIMNIIQSYGYDNDSLADERYGENTVEWKIKIKVKKVG